MIDRDEIARRFAAGESVPDIRRAVGTSSSVVYHHLRQAGLVAPPVPPPFRFTPGQVAAIKAEYAAVGAVALAARFGCGPQQVTRRAWKLGVKSAVRQALAGRTQAANNTTADLAFFDTWTPASAYVLGHFWADGCVLDRRGTLIGISYTATAADTQLLRDIAAAMGHTPTICEQPARDWVHKPTGNTRHTKPSVSMMVCSKVLAERLVAVHGLAPRKSAADLPYPANVPDDLLHHFARGNLDGDGSVTVRTGRRRAAVNWLGSPRFTAGLAAAVHRVAGVTPPSLSRTRDGLVRAGWAGKADVLRLRDWLYRDATVWLARKRAAFDAAAETLAAVRGYARRRRRDGTVVWFG